MGSGWKRRNRSNDEYGKKLRFLMVYRIKLYYSCLSAKQFIAVNSANKSRSGPSSGFTLYALCFALFWVIPDSVQKKGIRLHIWLHALASPFHYFLSRSAG